MSTPKIVLVCVVSCLWENHYRVVIRDNRRKFGVQVFRLYDQDKAFEPVTASFQPQLCRARKTSSPSHSGTTVPVPPLLITYFLPITTTICVNGGT